MGIPFGKRTCTYQATNSLGSFFGFGEVGEDLRNKYKILK
jgi:hypothetical protein